MNSLAASALALAIFACSSCAIAVPAATGTAPVVGQFMGQGEGDSFWVARYDDVVQATIRAAEKLSLQLNHEEIGEDRAELYMSDDRNQEIRILIERRTETVTRVRFDTGSRGLAGFARLLGRQIIDELHDADAFLVNWSDEEQAAPE